MIVLIQMRIPMYGWLKYATIEPMLTTLPFDATRRGVKACVVRSTPGEIDLSVQLHYGSLPLNYDLPQKFTSKTFLLSSISTSMTGMK
jgi:hypothetical protein